MSLYSSESFLKSDFSFILDKIFFHLQLIFKLLVEIDVDKTLSFTFDKLITILNFIKNKSNKIMK